MDSFFSINVWEKGRIILKTWLFCIFGSACGAPGGRTINFTIKIPFTIEMLHIKNFYHLPCSFPEVKNFYAWRMTNVHLDGNRSLEFTRWFRFLIVHFYSKGKVKIKSFSYFLKKKTTFLCACNSFLSPPNNITLKL